MIIIFFILIVLFSFIWYVFFKNNCLRQLYASLTFEENAVYTGEIAHLNECIENRKKLPLPVVEVSFNISQKLHFVDTPNTSISDFTNKQDIFSLYSYQRITRKFTIKCLQRGYYPIHELECKVNSLFFKNKYIKSYTNDTMLYVYAKRIHIPSIETVCEKIMGEIQCEKQLLEDPFAFASIREYQPYDSIKNINWKATAKSSTLMVNTFESTKCSKMMICLDVSDPAPVKFPHLVEGCISIAATLASKNIYKGNDVGLCGNFICEDDVQHALIIPSHAHGHIKKIEETLACISIQNIRCKFQQLLLPFDEDTVPIFITKNADDDLIHKLHSLSKRQKAILIIVTDKNSEHKYQSRSNLIIIYKEVPRS